MDMDIEAQGQQNPRMQRTQPNTHLVIETTVVILALAIGFTLMGLIYQDLNIMVHFSLYQWRDFYNKLAHKRWKNKYNKQLS